MLEQETESKIERLINKLQEIKSWGTEVERHTDTYKRTDRHTHALCKPMVD